VTVPLAILVASIWAELDISAFTIVPSAIFIDVTLESASLVVPMEPSSMPVAVTAPGAISLAVTGNRFLRSVTVVILSVSVITLASLIELEAIAGAAAALATSVYCNAP